ncbi:MAG: aminotransferase class V-fold PLP-dependent enzyme, partial [Bifidobacteriaceae bacterium]|nr:aminotransferase class V-fold PLP-dependent enzyme [Bifidobacteriaceae bacterium]
MVVYLDYAASAPLRPEAAGAWAAAAVPGNPSSVHKAGRTARATIDAARQVIAHTFGADPAEVILTSGGTEADNLALGGIFQARQTGHARPHVAVSAVEHHAVLESAWLLQARAGAKVTVLPVGRDGIVQVEALEELLERHQDAVALCSIMGANNETGALQPVQAVTELAAAHGVPVHSDWVHLAGKVPLDFAATNLAAASVSSHKLGGPAGIGARLVRRDTPISAIAGGGGQERGVRSGTLDARAAAGFAAALQAPCVPASRLEQMLQPLDALVAGSGGQLVSRTPPRHVAGTRAFSVPGCDAEVLVYLLDAAGIAVGSGAACTAGVVGPSHV